MLSLVTFDDGIVVEDRDLNNFSYSMASISIDFSYHARPNSFNEEWRPI